MTVSACLIVRDEAHHLFPCIASIYQQVDEIILLDTGSLDGTLNLDWLYEREPELRGDGPIAWPAMALVEHPWTDSFAEARNACIGYAQGDWILSIDADERLDGDLTGLLARATDEDAAFVVDVHSVFDAGSESMSSQVRLFRNHRGFHYRGRIHEQLATEDGADLPRTPSGLKFQHVGYDQRGITVLGGKAMTGARRMESKKARNRRLLDMGLAEEPENPRYHFTRMREHLRENEWPEAFAAGIAALTYWQAGDGRQRDFIAPILEYLLDAGRRSGDVDSAARVWDMVPAAYRTQRALTLYAVVNTARLG